MNSNPIGMFDSGVGGITVFSELVKEFPNEDIIYLGDTKRFPYGSKSKESIIELSKQSTDFLISKGVKVIIIACGTATSQALTELRKIYNIPIIGILEATVNEVTKENKYYKIGVIATSATINSKAWETELKKKNNNIEVISRACPLLASMAEEGWIDNKVAKYNIHEYISPFKEESIDKLILGCTHYPLYINLIRKELGNRIDIIDTGKMLRKYLRGILEKKKLLSADNNIPKYDIYLTDTESKFIQVANNLLQNENKIFIEKIKKI